MIVNILFSKLLIVNLMIDSKFILDLHPIYLKIFLKMYL